MTPKQRGAAATVLLLPLLVVAAFGYRSATSLPVVRHLDLPMADYPPDAASMRVILWSDLHVHGPGTPPSRVARIVQQINGLHPDVVITAGDFIGGNWFGRSYSAAEAAAPLSDLRSTHGAFAVLGNHDAAAGEGPIIAALERAHVRVLMNDAVSVGPLAIGGIDGALLRPFSAWQARREAVYSRLSQTPGVKILAVHRPDEAHYAPPWLHLVLAGHTHCGQIVLPLVGALWTGSDFGQLYLCGMIREGQRLTVVTAGVGTSKFPVRIGAPPDLWVIDIRAPSRTQRPQPQQ